MRKTWLVILIVILGLGTGVGAAFGVSRLLPQTAQVNLQIQNLPSSPKDRQNENPFRSLPGNPRQDEKGRDWQFEMPMMPGGRMPRQLKPGQNLPWGQQNGQPQNQPFNRQQWQNPQGQNPVLPNVPEQILPVPQLPQTELPSAGVNPTSKISLDDAVQVAQKAIAGKDNLAVGKVMEFERGFYVVIFEKDSGRGAYELWVDALRGRIAMEPGVGMMWNLKYGRGNTANDQENTLGVNEAVQEAQTVLDRQAPGAKVVESGITFYGYYTFEYSVDGKTAGLVSVNAMNSQAWVHTWLGNFVQSKIIQ